MLGLSDDDDAKKAVASMRGAYSVTMNPDVSICMNVIVGRRRNDIGGYIVDKFPLYYNHICQRWGSNLPLLRGYSFRTSALRDDAGAQLHSLRKDFHDIITDASEREDCAFLPNKETDSDDTIKKNIEALIEYMLILKRNMLVLSYDPMRAKIGKTLLEDEWELLKKHV